MSYTQGTRTYTDLISYIESICSVKFNSNDLERVKTLINQSIRTLYERFPFWGRYLTVLEPRAVQCGYIYPQENAVVVDCAPEQMFNGHYLWDAGLGIWKKTGDDSSKYHFIHESNTDELTMSFGDYDDVFDDFYITDSSGGDFSAYIWETVSGSEPTAIRTNATSNIYQFLHIRDYASCGGSGFGGTVPFVVDSRGAKILGGHHNRKVLYVTYKKPIAKVFGAGVGEDANVPSEFFDYAALSSARMYNLSKQINTDPQVRNITLREIEEAAMHQFMIQERNNPEFIQRITHTNL